jgi:putative redox protein
MQSKKVIFTNADGVKLSGRLDLPVDDKPTAYALFAHCFTCTKNLKAVNHINRALAREGIAVLRFDFTGLGESDGDFADTNFSSNVADLVAAAKFMAAEHEGPGILVGHSLGGAAVLQAAGAIPSARAAAVIGAPAEPAHVTRLLVDTKEQIVREGEAVVKLAGRSFKIKKQFLEDLEKNRMQETVAGLDKALLILHAPMDDTVGIENAARIFQAARHPKSFVSLDRADHLLSRSEDSLYAGSIIAAWASKYVATFQDRQSEEKPRDSRVAARIGRSGFTTDIRVGDHSLTADEPITAGGTNLGPNPYDLLCAALGACTVMTLRMYADRKRWPLAAATVRLEHQKIHAEDCRDCATQKGKLDRIRRELEIQGPLDGRQRKRLAEIADRCPVHRTLTSEIAIETRLTETDDMDNSA